MQPLSVFMHMDPKRLVVMSPATGVYQAARALEANHVGCVVVVENERIAGIVTDRDLAVRVIGYEQEARELRLRDVMTTEVATVPAAATMAEVAGVMLERRVRRVPIVDPHGRLAGLVTLDDLMVRGFEPDVVASIVTAQLGEAAPRKEQADLHPMSPTHVRPHAEQAPERRHQAHADASYRALLKRVMEETMLETEARADIAFEVVLTSLVERITPDQAANLLVQLPLRFRERMRTVPRGPNTMVTREAIERVLGARLDLGDARASELLGHLGRVLELSVSRGELEDVKAQLPANLRAIFH